MCVKEMSVYEYAQKVRNGWEEAFQRYDKELQLVSSIIDKKETKEKWETLPKRDKIFNVFNHIRPEEVNVIILGQDPYHSVVDGIPLACGMAFSVPDGVKIPSSLRNIFTEIKRCYDNFKPRSGDLTHWVKQGVFLLNMSLTTVKGQPDKYKKVWYPFTLGIIKYILEKNPDCLMVLWGNKAQSVMNDIKNKPEYLETSHPSGFSYKRGFCGCNHFIEINLYLEKKGKPQIKW